MKIKYEFEFEPDDGLLSTECPHRHHDIMVGSFVCSECKYFGSIDTAEQVVTCNYKKEEVNIEELKKEVEELKAKIAEFEKQGNDDWVPQIGQRFWFITSYGSVSTDIWGDGAEQREHLAFHNVYPSREMAEAALPDIIRNNAVVNTSKRVEIFVPDWDDNEQKKFFPCYGEGRWSINYAYSYNFAPSYVSTRENCGRVCDILNKEGVK